MAVAYEFPYPPPPPFSPRPADGPIRQKAFPMSHKRTAAEAGTSNGGRVLEPFVSDFKRDGVTTVRRAESTQIAIERLRAAEARLDARLAEVRGKLWRLESRDWMRGLDVAR